MQTLSVENHLKEMEQFLKSSEQLKIVLSNLENLNTANKNDLYEIVYNKKVIENWLDGTIENDDIRKSLEELLQSINIVLNSLSNSTLESIADKTVQNTKDLEKLNKLKYNDKKKYKGLIDKKQIIEKKKQGLIQRYLAKRCASIILIFAASLFTFSGAIRDVSESVTSEFASEQTSETLYSNEFTPDKDIINYTIKIFGFLVSIFSALIVMVGLLRICIDITYLAMPVVRYTGIFNRLIASELTELIKLNEMELNTSENKIIDYRDKFEVSLALLHNTEDYLERVKLINSGNINKEQMLKIYETLNELGIQLSNIKKGINSSNIIKRVESLVDAELLYTKYKDDIEKGIA